MRSRIVCTVVVVMLSLVALQAHAEVINFESVIQTPFGSGDINDDNAGYAGFNWVNTGWYSRDIGTDGYLNGYKNVKNGQVGIYTPDANNISFWGDPFCLTSVKIAAGWNNNQYVTFEGWSGGSKIHELNFLAPLEGMTKTFNWAGIDELWIKPDWNTGTDADSNDGGSGHHIALDDITINECDNPRTPELSTWALLACSGLVGVALRRRRKS